MNKEIKTNAVGETAKSTNSKQKKRTVLSLLLIAAILISGAFAFLTATDSKTNVFTVGNIDIELWENFDSDLNGTTEVYDSTATTPPTAENVIPGQEIAKEPYVKNTGANPCNLFMTVKVPVISNDDVKVTNDGDVYTLEGNKNIVVQAYAIQNEFADETRSMEAVWNTHFEGKSGIKVTDENVIDDQYTELFALNGVNTGSWKLLTSKTVVSGDDAYNYYLYAYATDATVNDATNCLLAKNAISDSLFTSVTVNADLGEPLNP